MIYSLRSFLLVTVLSLGFCSAQRPSPRRSPSYPWFPFAWYSEQINGKLVEKLAILVPVKVNDLRGNFVMQFDLGSDATTVYENTVAPYFANHTQLYALVDTAQHGLSDSGLRSYRTRGLALTLGPLRIPHPRLTAKFGDPVSPDSLYTTSQKLAGTIGGDIFAGKVLVIDYPHQRMCVLDSMDAYWRTRTRFVTSQVKENRFTIPLTIGQRTYRALFDTGSSLFALDTDEAQWKGLVKPGARVDSMLVNSWGKQVPYYGAPMRANAYLGSLQLPPAHAWFTRDPRHLAFAQAERIDGITGNALFVNDIIVLDFKQHRFGVVKHQRTETKKKG